MTARTSGVTLGDRCGDRHPAALSTGFPSGASGHRAGTPGDPRRPVRARGPPHGGPPMSIGGILLALVIGLVAGLIARAVIPGKQDLGIVATIALGLIGSLVGNLLASLLFRRQLEFDLGGWWASILGATPVLGVYVAVTGRGRRPISR